MYDVINMLRKFIYALKYIQGNRKQSPMQILQNSGYKGTEGEPNRMQFLEYIVSLS